MIINSIAPSLVQFRSLERALVLHRRGHDSSTFARGLARLRHDALL